MSRKQKQKANLFFGKHNHNSTLWPNVDNQNINIYVWKIMRKYDN